MMLDNVPDAPLLQTAKGAVFREARFFYEKRGRAKYISHLDVTRCMQRAVKRAGLSLWYTEGFNPHIYMTFALPLSLGYESLCEIMDVRLTEDISYEEAARRLDEALPPDLIVKRAAPPQHKPQEIVAAVYELSIGEKGTEPKELLQRFLAFFAAETIEVEKRTKKGIKRIDIKPDCVLLDSGIDGEAMRLTLKTTAGSVKNINPTLLTDAFLQGADACTQVTRKEILLADGSRFA